MQVSKNPAYVATSTVEPTSQAAIIENEPAYEVILYGGQSNGMPHIEVSHADTIVPSGCVYYSYSLVPRLHPAF